MKNKLFTKIVKVIALIVFLLLVLCASTFIINRYREKDTNNGYTGNIFGGEKYDGSTPNLTSDSDDEKTIKATIYPLAYVTSTQKEYVVFNPEENEVSMIYTFLLDGKELCKSEEIGPGYMDKVDLYTVLGNKGVYDVDLNIETTNIYTGSKCNSIHTSIEIIKD